MNGGMLIFVLFVAFMIVAAIFGSISERKRQQELAALADRLGFSFSAKDNEAFATGWGFLSRLQMGSNRYAFNILRGEYEGQRMCVFDYHYETGSGKEKHDHYLTLVLLIVPEAFPQLTIAPEGVFSRIAQAFGYDDIDFESAEFSRAFCVRSKDRKFAYDVCNAQMIEYLLANRKLKIELNGPAMVLEFDSQLAADEIEFNLERLTQIRLRLPEYLFTKS